MKLKKKILITDWIAKKPYQNYSQIDLEYLDVANKVHQTIIAFKFLFEQLQISQEEGKNLAIFLTCFLEDLVTETNIWQTFLNANKALYNKKLPFFDITVDYAEGEINLADLKFLIWYYLNCINPERFLSPYDDYLGFLATNVDSILKDEFDFLPNNKNLKKEYFLDLTMNFYEIRVVMQKLFFDSYLFGLDAKSNLIREMELFIVENKKELKKNPEFYKQSMFSLTNKITFDYRTKLLANKSCDWLLALLGTNNKINDKLKNCSEIVTGYYFYRKTEGKCYVFEHIASEKKFKMYSESYKGNLNSDKNAIYYLEMVQWGEHYMLSGISSQIPFDANFILDLKNNSNERLNVSNVGIEFLRENIAITKIQEKSFLKTFGSSIVFAAEDQMQNCIDLYKNNYHQDLKKNTKKDFVEAEKRFQKKGYFIKNETFTSLRKDKNIVVFFNTNQGIEIYNDICEVIPDSKNPFYAGELVPEIKQILFSSQYSREFTEYYVTNYGSKLDFYKTGTGFKYLKDLDFLIRFWKPNHYFNLPNLTVI